jgi:hypothetical protein
MAESELKPTASPGEVGAPVASGAIATLLIAAFGVDAERALAISGAVGVLMPYAIKVIVWWRTARAKAP